MADQLEAEDVGCAASHNPRRLTEAVLASFDRALQVSRFDDQLFDVQAGGNLAPKLEALVAAIHAADVESVVRKSRWRHALTGADVEARLRFAIRRQACEDALEAARVAARLTAGQMQRLEDALPRILADAARLAEVAAKAETLSNDAGAPTSLEDAELHARFARRIANLSTIRASNGLIAAQVHVAIAHNRDLLDRFADVRMVLFPVWERHTLAVVQSSATGDAISATRAATDALVARLVGKLGAQA